MGYGTSDCKLIKKRPETKGKKKQKRKNISKGFPYEYLLREHMVGSEFAEFCIKMPNGASNRL
jgi:hypothetical protein